jgi:hypothetical protein
MLPDFPIKDQRHRPRVRLSCRVRIRSALPKGHDFDEVLATENTCRDGFYAATIIACYKKHLRILVTFPYSVVPGAINRDYIGEVIRVEGLPDGHNGIALRLLTALDSSVHDAVPIGLSESSYVLWRIADERKS